MILTLEQMHDLSIDEIINLYRIGYRLEENQHITISLADPTVDPVVNFGKVTVSALHNNTDTSIGISDSSRLPDPSTSGDFNLIWWNADDYPDPSDDPNREIVRCTANSSNILTVTRGQEGISASNKNTSGKTYKMVLSMTAKTISDIQTDAQNKVDTHAAVTSSIHGISGSIVGTTDIQTLTHKTITDKTNNVAANYLNSVTTQINVSSATAPVSGQVLTATGGTAATWQTPSTGPSPATSVVSETSFGQSAAVGTSTNYSRQDHTHGTPSSSGFLTTGNAATSVVSETSFGQSSAIGSSTNYARQDHTHGTPSTSGIVVTGSGTTGQYASTKATTTTSVNWNSGNVQSMTLANGSNSFTFTNGISGGRYMLILASGGASTTATWTGVKWPNATAPNLSTTAGHIDIVTFVYDGTNYYGNVSFNYY